MCDEEDMDIQDDLLMEVPSDEKSTSNNSMDIENVEKISSFNSVICEKDIDEDAEILVEVPPLEEKSASNNNNNSTDSIKGKNTFLLFFLFQLHSRSKQQ